MTGFLRKFWPQSLYAQLLMVAALALLVAQIANGYFLLNGLRGRAQLESSTMLISSYINRAERAARRGSEIIDNRRQLRDRRKRRTLVYYPGGPQIPDGFRVNDFLTERAAGFLTQAAVDPSDQPDMYISEGRLAALPTNIQAQMQRSALFERIRRNNQPPPRHAMLLSVKQAGNDWIHVAVPTRPVNPGSIWALFLQTLLLYVAVLLPLAIVGRRISKPLGNLRGAMGRFAEHGQARALTAKGPSDVKELIDTFNSLQQRVEQLLSEKDVMLGAIGHDLKTPLASLRVRVESVDDEDDRNAMVNTIDETTAMLDDMLTLARLGKSGELSQQTDIAALIETVMDDFSGDEDRLSFAMPDSRLTANIRPMLLRRAVQNLVGNALHYGEMVTLNLMEQTEGGMFQIIVDDDGPGIPEADIDAMFEPFTRAESSRNRDSGGTGLGLTIARAIARSHGGDVTLQPRSEGGLRAILSFRVSDD